MTPPGRAPLCAELPLRDVLADVPGEHLVDERLIPDATPARRLAKLFEHGGVQTNRDQLARRIPDWRAPDAPHRPQLIGRGLWNVAEINLSRRTPHAPDGSPGAR